MTPIKFEQANGNLGAPVGWDKGRHGECGSLPIYHAGDQYVSCWRLSWRERLAALFIGRVWLRVVSIGHPPVALHAKRSVFAPTERREPVYRDT